MYDLAASVVADVAAQAQTTGGVTGQMKQLGAGVAIGFGAIGPGVGIGLAVLGALNAIGRNPETEGSVRNIMILGAALAESVAIYALLVALLLLFT
jgi:F-type H+-transporting ATPase subunit c